MQFFVHTAKTQLSKLIEAALAGEEVVIARGSRPVVPFVPVAQSGFRFGLCQGKIGTPPDFLAHLDYTELELWEGG